MTPSDIGTIQAFAWCDNDGVIDARTVSTSQCGVMVNALFLQTSSIVTSSHTDDEIKALYDNHFIKTNHGVIALVNITAESVTYESV